MSKRLRDIDRKYLSGSKKRAIAKAKKAEADKVKGALEKYFSKTLSENEEKQVEPQYSEDDDTEGSQSEEDTQDNQSGNLFTESEIGHFQNIEFEKQGNSTVNMPASAFEARKNENSKSASSIELTEDPATWPEMISQGVRDYLVKKGPPKIMVEFFPKNESGSHFSKFHCKRKLPNGEIVDRPWLIYSVSSDKIFCYYCKLFDNAANALASSGFNNWPNICTRLAEHEKSKKHLEAMLSCCELQQRISTEKSINEVAEKIIRQEERRWHKVFERLVATVQFLSERNLPFRGPEEHIGSPHNGNFLGVVELLGKFDPVMEDHLQKIQNKQIHDHYLGKRIQNELINIMGQAVLQEIILRIKAAKYFAIILDCTPDISHQEQMSMVIRYVADGVQSNVPAGVYEHFIKFLVVESSTGENLYNTLLHELETLGLDVENIRGQGYDNGANMKGQNSGVQSRLLQKNSRAFFTPCACHNYNLVLGDMAKTCPEAMTFFGTLQRIYTLFASSTKRWIIFRKHVTGLSVKPLSETRWECRMDSVKAVRYHAAEICNALEELAENTDDAQAKSDAESLVSQITKYKFLVSLVFWHTLLFQVNYVSKELQSNSMDVAAGLSSFQKLCNWLKTYREKGFDEALIDANELAKDLEVEPVFKTRSKRLCKKRRLFDYESADEPLSVSDPKTAFRVQCFNQVVDKALQTLEPRFEQLKKHQNLFGFLCNFQDLSKDTIRKCAADLEVSLTEVKLAQEKDQVKTTKVSDIDGYMLCEEIEALRPILPSKIKTPIKMLEFLACNNRSTAFPNLFIALRIFLTIPVTVASGERSFSKLKLIKTYLRSSIQQERLNSLAIISIESDISRSLNLDKIIKDFAEKKARKIKIN